MPNLLDRPNDPSSAEGMIIWWMRTIFLLDNGITHFVAFPCLPAGRGLDGSMLSPLGLTSTALATDLRKFFPALANA